MKIALIFFLAALLAGCAAMEKDSTTFEPLKQDGSDQVFRFKTIAGTNNPPDSSSAEEMRMEVLKIWLEDNALTAQSYEILSRKLVVRSTSVFGTVYDIYYEVRVHK